MKVFNLLLIFFGIHFSAIAQCPPDITLTLIPDPGFIICTAQLGSNIVAGDPFRSETISVKDAAGNQLFLGAPPFMFGKSSFGKVYDVTSTIIYSPPMQPSTTTVCTRKVTITGSGFCDPTPQPPANCPNLTLPLFPGQPPPPGQNPMCEVMITGNTLTPQYANYPMFVSYKNLTQGYSGTANLDNGLPPLKFISADGGLANNVFEIKNDINHLLPGGQRIIYNCTRLVTLTASGVCAPPPPPPVVNCPDLTLPLVFQPQPPLPVMPSKCTVEILGSTLTPDYNGMPMVVSYKNLTRGGTNGVTLSAQANNGKFTLNSFDGDLANNVFEITTYIDNISPGIPRLRYDCTRLLTLTSSGSCGPTPPQPNPAPTITSPTNGALMDNGCSNDPTNGIDWTFSWTPVNPNAPSYNLVIGRVGQPVLFDGVVSGNSKMLTLAGYIVDANTSGWTVKIRARDANGITWGAFSAPVPFTVEPLNTDCPPCVTPVSGPSTSYNAATDVTTVSWSPVQNALGYTLEYRNVSANGAFVTVATATNSVALTLARGASYQFFYRVRCSAAFTSGNSPTISANSPCPSLTSAPNVVYNSADFSATLTWAAVVGVNGYKIEYRPVGFNDPWNMLQTNTNSILIRGLTSGLRYEFRVTTLCPVVSGVPSSTTEVVLPCGNISDAYSTDLTTTSVKLYWKSNGARYYDIVSEGVVIATIDSSYYHVKNLLPDNTYDFTIIPKCNLSDGIGYRFDITTLKSPVPLPCNSPIAKIIKRKSTSAIIGWQAVSGVRRYRIRYKLKSSIGNWLEKLTTGTTIQLDNLTPKDLGDHTYEVEVQSICSNSTSSNFSSTLVFDTKSSCPEIDALTLGYSTYSLAVLSWDEEPDAKSYTAEYYTLPYDATKAKTLSSVSNTIVLQGLMPETTYGVRVKTMCGATSSLFSEPTFFKTVPVLCPEPVKIKVSNVRATSATLSWSNLSIPSSFELGYKKNDAQNWTVVQSPTHFTTLNNLSPNTVYNLRVRSICPFNTMSVWSYIKNFNTENAPSSESISTSNIKINTAPKQDNGLLFDVFVSPNPTTGVVKIDIDSENDQALDIAVVNRLGQIVIQKKIDIQGTTTTNLDLSNLPNDMYLLRLYNGQKYTSTKIILMR
jgi:hypothetical protein